MPDLLASRLNISFKRFPKLFNTTCGGVTLAILHWGQQLTQLASLKLRFAIAARFRYCEFGGHSNTENLSFWAWVTPFKLSVWITLLVVMIASAFGISATGNGVNEIKIFLFRPTKFLSNLFTVIAIYFRQTSGRDTKLKWVIHFGMIVVLSVYETYFTSMVVVPVKVERNPGFVSLLKMGYRIAFHRFSTNSSSDISQDFYLNRFNYDFEKLGVAGWIRNEKYFYDNRNQTDADKLISNNTLKVMVDISVQPDFKKRTLTQQEKYNAAENMKCRFAPEIFLKTNSYEMALVNLRVEILSLLGSIREFGFLEFWNRNFHNLQIYRAKKETRGLLLKRKVFVDHTEVLRWEDLIRIYNLLSLLIIFGVGIFI
ncbi:hypothetical protein Fcan01_15590 [Folsomia candida]|uniref:Uncharacterized protein n=1 Tax=Folsomia candida TaxID=158441 RepID=A0A226DWR2_FOLCA|nr:hypothetical protein Fcan01_15590 [Folsomia candida]